MNSNYLSLKLDFLIMNSREVYIFLFAFTLRSHSGRSSASHAACQPLAKPHGKQTPAKNKPPRCCTLICNSALPVPLCALGKLQTMPTLEW